MELCHLWRQMADHQVGLGVPSRVNGYWGVAGAEDGFSAWYTRAWLLPPLALLAASSPHLDLTVDPSRKWNQNVTATLKPFSRNNGTTHN